ncbi:MAG: HyaD/HybD family hydrogenase maturation endopeptidase [Deltaproteobacteria bacterium]
MKRIIGIGNLLLKDEGVGVHLVESLKSEKLPEGVELVDGATCGFDLLPFIEESDKVVIVDAMKAPDGEPGAVYRFTPEDYQTRPCGGASLHDVTLEDIFSIIKTTKRKRLPEIVIFGVEPAEIGWGMELTDKVKAVLPRLKELVLKEMKDA